ncbi:hypothetical protein CYLTODRAFT_410626 [Cylindrobasidium torrendii FP15055 ss-10]|uniref:Uncharacterized protein n=1 Tax=Cylindrobasidium torrendii FP15055 ss-10 TaxID=1314674 RepID=A0A0D7BDA0_9AGAR|nr:hypothetical protein CYLTODRAFT_410626 [Cylindrobasidium torrendii FP15055 ss-10]
MVSRSFIVLAVGSLASAAAVTTTFVPADSAASATTTTSAASGTETLNPGYSFIRAVVDPNFHKYLRSEVKGTASDAVLGEPSDAAQFQITDGQLIQDAAGTPLYANVQTFEDSDGKKLKVTWKETKDTLGTFTFSGDTTEWSSPTVTRAATNAWLVCEDEDANKDVYLNLGPYAYNTPPGCVDQTIHAYTGSTATA